MASHQMVSQSKPQLWRLYKELNPNNTGNLTYRTAKKKTLINVVKKLQIKQILETNLIPRITTRQSKQRTAYLKAFFNSEVIPILQERKFVMVIPNITIYDLSFGDTVEVREIYERPQIITQIKKGERLTKSKIKTLIEKFVNQNNFYKVRYANPDDDPPMNYTPNGIYYNEIYKRVSNDITATINPLDDTVRDIGALIVRDNETAPIYHSIGYKKQSEQKENTKYNECGLDQILKAIQGNKNFKNLTRDKILNEMEKLNGNPIDRKNIQVKNILDYLKSKNISYRIVNGQKQVIASFKREQNIGHGGKTLVFMIQNDHIYLIEDDKIRTEIIYNNKAKKNNINWKDANISIAQGNINQIYQNLNEFKEQKEKDNVIFITSINNGKYPVHNLNLIVDVIYKKEKLIVENIKMDKYGNITNFSYHNKWIIYNTDYLIIKDILKAIQELESIKNRKRFVFRNQPIQSITADLINEFNGAMPKSNLNLQVSKNLRKYPKIPYMEALKVISERQSHNAFSVDIRRCHTSIIYNRKHSIGIFRPNNTIRKYRGEIIEGSMYFINKHIKLGSIKINKAFYDSQFISLLLKEEFITEADLTFEIVPSFTLRADYFKSIIDKIYKILPTFTKDLINKFIGTLGVKDIKVINGELSTSEQFKNFWTSNKGLYKQLGNGNLNLLYNLDVKDAINTNLPIYNGILDMTYYKLYEMEKQVKAIIPDIQPIYIHSDSITFYKQGLTLTGNIKHTGFSLEKKQIHSEFNTQCDIEPYDSDDEDDDITTLNIDDVLKQLNSTIPLEYQNENKLGIYRIERTDIPLNISKKEFENIQVQNTDIKFIERDNVEEMLIRNNSLSIFGEGGTGKTHHITNIILPKLKELKKKVIVCSTSHKALDNLRKKGISCQTMASLFHLKPAQTIENKLAEILRKTDYIINDEYTMSSLKYMEYFYTLFKQGMKFIFIGDYRQTTPIEAKGNMKLNYRNSEFFKEMSEYNYKELTEQHRYDQALRKVALNVYHKGILKINKKQVSKKCKYNICYKNDTRTKGNKLFSNENINVEKHLKVDKDFVIIKGTPIICKVNEIDKGLFNNRIFEIKKWKEKNITIYNDTETLEIDVDTMKDKFQLAYYLTTHSAQGSTFDMEFEIHDTNIMSRNILYTAITRATSLNNVFIHNYNSIKPKLNNIRKEYFTYWYNPKDISKKEFEGSVYELYDIKTGEPFYVGSVEKSEGINTRMKQHKQMSKSKTLPKSKVHTYISENKVKFNIREITKIKYDNIDELHQEEYRLISLYVINGEIIYNIHGMDNITEHNPLRKGEVEKKEVKVKGEIIILKDRVRFRYYVDGARKIKSFRYTKKRTEKQALEQAKAFQLEYYS